MTSSTRLFKKGAAMLAVAACCAARAAGPAPSEGGLVLLPQSTVDSGTFAAGCWVHLFDGIDFRGQRLTLVGPMALPDMRRTGTPWRDWDSIVVGPRAAVTLYIAADFGLPVATFKHGQRVSDLTATTGRFEDINSVRVECRT